MLPVRCHDPRLAFRGPRASAQAPVKPTAGLACERRFLAHGASACSSAAALEGALGAKTPRNALLKVAICHAGIFTCFGFFNTPFLMMWLGMRGSVHGPRSKQNHPTQIELMQH